MPSLSKRDIEKLRALLKWSQTFKITGDGVTHSNTPAGCITAIKWPRQITPTPQQQKQWFWACVTGESPNVPGTYSFWEEAPVTAQLSSTSTYYTGGVWLMPPNNARKSNGFSALQVNGAIGINPGTVVKVYPGGMCPYDYIDGATAPSSGGSSLGGAPDQGALIPYYLVDFDPGGFWAVITSTISNGLNKWLYGFKRYNVGWTDGNSSTPSDFGFTPSDDGDLGEFQVYAENTLEIMNGQGSSTPYGGSTMTGAGINSANFPSGFYLQPAPIGAVVWMRQSKSFSIGTSAPFVAGGDEIGNMATPLAAAIEGSVTFAFQFNNQADGTCPAQYDTSGSSGGGS